MYDLSSIRRFHSRWKSITSSAVVLDVILRDQSACWCTMRKIILLSIKRLQDPIIRVRDFVSIFQIFWRKLIFTAKTNFSAVDKWCCIILAKHSIGKTAYVMPPQFVTTVRGEAVILIFFPFFISFDVWSYVYSSINLSFCVGWCLMELYWCIFNESRVFLSYPEFCFSIL